MDEFVNAIQTVINSLQQMDINPTEKNINILFGSYRSLEIIKQGLMNYKPEVQKPAEPELKKDDEKENQNDGAE